MTTSLKMLWIEDDHTTIDAVVLPLRKKGWAIKACCDYETADRIIQKEDRFDFYLIDLILPRSCTEMVEESIVKEDDVPYLGLPLIERVRARFGNEVPIGVFSVVHDPLVDTQLQKLNVSIRFPKGTTSNAEICKTIENSLSQQTSDSNG